MKLVVKVGDGADMVEVVAGLVGAGFEVQHIMGAIGFISGTASSGRLDVLRAVPGVTAVEEDGTMHAL